MKNSTLKNFINKRIIFQPLTCGCDTVQIGQVQNNSKYGTYLNHSCKLNADGTPRDLSKLQPRKLKMKDGQIYAIQTPPTDEEVASASQITAPLKACTKGDIVKCRWHVVVDNSIPPSTLYRMCNDIDSERGYAFKGFSNTSKSSREIWIKCADLESHVFVAPQSFIALNNNLEMSLSNAILPNAILPNAILPNPTQTSSNTTNGNYELKEIENDNKLSKSSVVPDYFLSDPEEETESEMDNTKTSNCMFNVNDCELNLKEMPSFGTDATSNLNDMLRGNINNNNIDTKEAAVIIDENKTEIECNDNNNYEPFTLDTQCAYYNDIYNTYNGTMADEHSKATAFVVNDTTPNISPWVAQHARIEGKTVYYNGLPVDKSFENWIWQQKQCEKLKKIEMFLNVMANNLTNYAGIEFPHNCCDESDIYNLENAIERQLNKLKQMEIALEKINANTKNAYDNSGSNDKKLTVCLKMVNKLYKEFDNILIQTKTVKIARMRWAGGMGNDLNQSEPLQKFDENENQICL